MSKAGLKFARRCADNMTQQHVDFRFVAIVGTDLHQLGLLAEKIVAVNGGWEDNK